MCYTASTRYGNTYLGIFLRYTTYGILDENGMKFKIREKRYDLYYQERWDERRI